MASRSCHYCGGVQGKHQEVFCPFSQTNKANDRRQKQEEKAKKAEARAKRRAERAEDEVPLTPEQKSSIADTIELYFSRPIDPKTLRFIK